MVAAAQVAAVAAWVVVLVMAAVAMVMAAPGAVEVAMGAVEAPAARPEAALEGRQAEAATASMECRPRGRSSTCTSTSYQGRSLHYQGSPDASNQ